MDRKNLSIVPGNVTSGGNAPQDAPVGPRPLERFPRPKAPDGLTTEAAEVWELLSDLAELRSERLNLASAPEHESLMRHLFSLDEEAKHITDALNKIAILAGDLSRLGHPSYDVRGIQTITREYNVEAVREMFPDIANAAIVESVDSKALERALEIRGIQREQIPEALYVEKAAKPYAKVTIRVTK